MQSRTKHTHAFETTTSDKYLKCSCGAVRKSMGEEIVRSKPVARLSWSDAEHKMLNKLRKPNYADYAKAERDLSNYWLS